MLDRVGNHNVGFLMIRLNLQNTKPENQSVFHCSIMGMGGGAGPPELGKSARKNWKLGKVETCSNQSLKLLKS